MTGTLYLVATPIGNYEDMTFRAISVLKSVDLVIYEERREGERLLRHFEIQKPVETLNEHNEAAATDVILRHLKSGKNVAVVSDCGTPVFSDPGQLLVRRAIESGITIVPIPGASSLLPALTVSGFSADQFVYYGWLSPKKERRLAELRQLMNERRTIVLMDTPYRLVPLLRDLANTFQDTRRICVAFNLTMPDERKFYGTANELYRRLGSTELKGEFVIVVEGRGRDEGRDRSAPGGRRAIR
ncbi:MAG: Uroporphyrin-III C/tetrapyrrole (Corrin/Porphyrin) methyltransferase [Bacteroidetes bacterium]|nr:Uroporphyrin-III C/tetrapyrrole (Corrin/Porphyrin) methyltransferase [Bacteroidota bacterium]